MRVTSHAQPSLVAVHVEEVNHALVPICTLSQVFGPRQLWGNFSTALALRATFRFNLPFSAFVPAVSSSEPCTVPARLVVVTSGQPAEFPIWIPDAPEKGSWRQPLV